MKMANQVRGNVFRCQSPADLSNARNVAIEGRRFLEQQALTPTELNAWELAITEALNNAVEHMQPDAEPHPIQLEILALPEEIEVRITDHTPGFDWPEDPTLPDPLSEDGRGLFLIQASVDIVRYWRDKEENCLILKRHRETPGTDSGTCLEDCKKRVAELESTLEEMTEELGYNYEALVAIFRRSADLGNALDQEAFASRVLDDLLQITGADLSVLRLARDQGARLDPFLIRSPSGKVPKLQSLSLTMPPPSGSPMKVKMGIEQTAVHSHQDVWFKSNDTQWQQDPLLQVGNWETGLCHAIYANQQLIGSLTLGRTSAETFSTAQINLLHTFADFLAIQLLNARLQDERLQTRLMHRELEIAANIQETLLPRALPESTPFSLAGSCRNALQVGGDLFDVLAVGNRGILFLVADVMGKGVPAALFGAILRSTVRSLPHLHHLPHQLLATANASLVNDLSRVDMFITVACLHLDRVTGTLTIASAGHPPAFMASHAGAPVTPLGDAGLPIGIDPLATYTPVQTTLGPGGWILIHTDGVTETRNPKGELLGEQRLIEWLESHSATFSDAESFKSGLRHMADAFREGTSLTDDETFLLAVRHPSKHNPLPR